MVTLLGFCFIFSSTIKAQQRCYASNPPGTRSACGYTTGTFRPQPGTLSSNGRIIESPGMWYAPVGKRQQYWYQYYPGTSGQRYGQREPNPFSQNGNLSVSRTIVHLTYTRVLPAIRRRF